jgi:hypothetical protein
MTMGARKRDARLAKVERFCMNCKTTLRLYDEIEPELYDICDGSGVLPAKGMVRR